LWQHVAEFWKRNSNNKDNWVPERWENGESTVNHWESPTYMVSLHNSSLVGGGRELEQAIWNTAQKTLEGWTGQKLRGCSLYGIRVYTEGSILHTHVDRLPLVSSAILNVAQDTDEPWPLEVIGHDGKAHNLTMEPGEMLLYESHSILHGRPFPLKGKYFANIFVHFEPITEKEGEFPPYLQPTPTGTQFYRHMMTERQAELRKQEKVVVSTLVHTLAGSGRLEDLKTVVEKDPRLVHAEDKGGWTPLHEAARGGHIENIHYLLKKDANINAITHEGETPMFIAERYLGAGSASVKFLQSKGGIRKEALKIPRTLPHSLAGDGKIVQLRELFEKNERIVHLPDDHGWTPLHEAARGGHILIVEYLLQKGAALNGQTLAGGTPIYYAAKYLGKESDMYQFLKSLGAVHLGPDL
jgi:prolyl 4-hydroxylase